MKVKNWQHGNTEIKVNFQTLLQMSENFRLTKFKSVHKDVASLTWVKKHDLADVGCWLVTEWFSGLTHIYLIYMMEQFVSVLNSTDFITTTTWTNNILMIDFFLRVFNQFETCKVCPNLNDPRRLYIVSFGLFLFSCSVAVK